MLPVHAQSGVGPLTRAMLWNLGLNLALFLTGVVVFLIPSSCASDGYNACWFTPTQATGTLMVLAAVALFVAATTVIGIAAICKMLGKSAGDRRQLG